MFKFLRYFHRKERVNTNTSALADAQGNIEKEKFYRQRRNTARMRMRLLRWIVWMDFAGTTTLHGPAHLSTTRGKTRIYYALVVTLCSILFIFHTAHLIRHFRAYPILTAIKYDNMDFRYPDITLCPHSPFTDAQLFADNETSALIERVYAMAKEKWWRNPDVLNMSPNAFVKRSLLGQFYRNSLKIGKRLFDHVIFCELNGVDCLDQFLVTEHPVYYRCFTLRIKQNPPFPAGPTHGVQIVLHRGPRNAQPLLVLDESEPFLVQSNVAPLNKSSLRPNASRVTAALPKDGFYVVFHEYKTFPNYPLQNLANGLTLRYGRFTRIGLSSMDLNSINLKRRPCLFSESIPKIQLSRHDRMSDSNFKSDKPKEDETLSEFEYTQQSCLANFRQLLTKEECGCFSDAYSIPYSARHVGLKYCLDVEQSSSNVVKMPEIIACVHKVENMTDAEIAKAVIPTIPGDGMKGCPLRCDQRDFHIHLHYTSDLKQDFDPERFITYFERVQLLGKNNSFTPHIQLDGAKINATELIVLDISPISEGVSQIVEDRAYTVIQFLSELGGVSGLYVGITLYTLAELFDLTRSLRLGHLVMPMVSHAFVHMSDTQDTSAVERFEALMSQWRSERNQAGYIPVEILTQLAGLFEEQINIYYHADPDPLDDRHPLRAQSKCEFGLLLRLISAHDTFFNRLTEYLCCSDDPHNSTVRAAARLLCCIQLGVTISVTVSETDSTVNSLYKFAFSNAEPTNCYALLILGSILDNAELLYVTKQRNIELVSVVLERMSTYTAALDQDIAEHPTPNNDDFSRRLGSFCLEPLNWETKLRLCMTYLTSLAEYQDMMPFMYDGGVLKYVYLFLEPKYSSRDIRLTFEALRLLANLLCHRCIHLDFVESQGLELLMKVPRPSVAATAVGVVMYYTSYFEDAMERMCTLRPKLLEDLMSYALWLVECSHPSARCYALYFLNIALCYGAFFRIFTARNGLRYLFNALCVLPIRLTEDQTNVQKDTASWHVVRASLLTIRRYLDISLLRWIDSLDPSLAGVFDEPPKLVLAAGNRLISYTTEQMNRLISLVVSRMRPSTTFSPILELHNLGAIPVLYRIIARNAYAHANWPGRNECTRLAVDILNVMCLSADLAEEIVATDVYSFPGGITFSGISPLRIFRSPRRRGRNFVEIIAETNYDDDDEDRDDENPAGGGEGNVGINEAEEDDDEMQVVVGSGLHLRPSLHRGTAELANSNSTPPWRNNNGDNNPSRRGLGHGRRSAPPPGNSRRDIDRLADEPSSEDHVNGLLMLITLIRDDEGWDVAVQKAILSFIGTLVYRPIDEREHPDQPVLAGSVMPPNTYPACLDDSTFATPKNRLFPSGVLSRGSSSRKRRLDEILSPGEDSFSLVSHCKSLALATPDSSRPQRYSHGKPSGTPNPSVSTPPVLLRQQMRLWCAVRRQHGLMFLLHQLDVTQPISEADSIRTLACRGLVGMARSEEVRSMLAKLPLFTKSQLQLLMKEPILPDRMVEHAEFCRYATLLMRLVLGSLSDGSLTDGDMSMDRVRRAVIVARTRIQWDHEELLELIWRHLQAKGLHKSAAILQQEARLRLGNSLPHQLPLFGHDGDSDSEPPTPPTLANTITTTTSSNIDVSTPTLKVNKIKPLTNSSPSVSKTFRDRLERTPSHKQQLQLSQTSCVMMSGGSGGNSVTATPITGSVGVGGSNTTGESSEMTLSKIVESFLMHQHAQCPYPVSVCPRFSLHHPHRCPEPRIDTWLGPIVGVPSLVAARESFAGCHHMRCAPRRFIRRFIHSRFMPIFTVRDLDNDLYTAAAFGRGVEMGEGDDGLFLGTSTGSVCWVNVEEATLPVELFRAQTSPICRLEHARDGRRLLVCTNWGEPALLVARLEQRNTDCGNTNSASAPFYSNPDRPVFAADSGKYAEFSRTGTQSMLVATDGKIAKIFDLTTGQRVIDLFSSVKQSDYLMNKATFSVDDHLVLNDGVVWDIRCPGSGSTTRPVHKIDKFQDVVSGVFHPNGLEIVVGSAVWDMRTWRLLHTVQALDKLEVTFSENAEVIYAGSFGMDFDDPLDEIVQSGRVAMQSMFRTVDALDYSLIASVDVKHRIEQLAVDRRGLRLALVEKFGDKNVDEPLSQCRVYSIGQKRSTRELDTEDDDDEEVEDRHDDDDDDDDADYVHIPLSSSPTSVATDEDAEDEEEEETMSEGSSESSDGGSESSWETEEEMEVSSFTEEN
uniref:Protein vprbp n=1 Tax=Echinococcus granulosus TaxID=6210 RepID=A0A068WBK6_ECHGR|nr:protein vprbp [Echinococcus granulosus]